MRQAILPGGADAQEAPSVEHGAALARPQGPAFIYSGNGAQWDGMGRALLSEPHFTDSLREIDAHFAPLAGYSLEAELAGRNGAPRYALTEVAQPALFAIQVGITRLLQHRGFSPIVVAGHSVGEVAAAWAAGALTLRDAIELIHRRSALQASTRGAGQMCAVALDAASTEALLHAQQLQDDIVIAGINSPQAVTLAGPATALDAFEARLRADGIQHKRLALDYAFHSPAMDATREPILHALHKLPLHDTAIPFISAVSGGPLPGHALDAHYWWQNIRQPVRFSAAIQQLIADGINIFVEIGPHPILRSYIKDCCGPHPATILATLSRKHDNFSALESCMERMRVAGVVPVGAGDTTQR
jgi:phthiocerol/phenolphthiocerol synthesis type-I polyketide synthase C